MRFRPLHDRVLVRRVEQDAKTAGGIIIPDTAKEKPQEGEVVAVGAGTRGEDGKLHALHDHAILQRPNLHGVFSLLWELALNTGECQGGRNVTAFQALSRGVRGGAELAARSTAPQDDWRRCG